MLQVAVYYGGVGDHCVGLHDLEVYGCKWEGTTTTTRTETTTTGTNTADELYARRLDSLEKQLEGHADGKADTSALQALELALRARLDAVAANSAAAVKALQADNDKLRGQLAARTAELEALAARVDSATATLTQPELPPPAGADACDAGADGAAAGTVCAPEVEADETNLVLRARSGQVLFSSDSCGATDLCKMAADVQALRARFDE